LGEILQMDLSKGVGKLTSPLSATFRPLFIAIKWQNSINLGVTANFHQNKACLIATNGEHGVNV
jgi:hypothetical protein